MSSNETDDLLANTAIINKDSKADENSYKDQNDKVLTTRSVCNVSGGRGSEYVCQCNGKMKICNKQIFHSIANLRKCRSCNVYVLISHLSKYWTCGK